MIIEGVVTTLNLSGQLNVAPMGPIVDETMSQFILRPFKTSTTYLNLQQRPFGVFHVVDDVLLIARAALDRLVEAPESVPAARIAGRVLNDCCRWYEFEVANVDDSADRTMFVVKTVHSGRIRDMVGFNRAKHAVLEATILATRLHLISEASLREHLSALAIPVEKTSGPQEREAFKLVTDFIDDWFRIHRQDQALQ